LAHIVPKSGKRGKRFNGRIYFETSFYEPGMAKAGGGLEKTPRNSLNQNNVRL